MTVYDRLREAIGIAADLGIPETALNHAAGFDLAHTEKPTTTDLYRAAAALRVNADWLIRGDGASATTHHDHRDRLRMAYPEFFSDPEND